MQLCLIIYGCNYYYYYCYCYSPFCLKKNNKWTGYQFSGYCLLIFSCSISSFRCTYKAPFIWGRLRLTPFLPAGDLSTDPPAERSGWMTRPCPFHLCKVDIVMDTSRSALWAKCKRTGCPITPHWPPIQCGRMEGNGSPSVSFFWIWSEVARYK